jgi:putative transposase
MARTSKAAEPQDKPLPTIWNVSDELWSHVQSVLEAHDPPAKYGPARIDQRKALDGVIYRMRTGCQWNHLPEEFGDDASVHRTLQRWVGRDVIRRLWALLVGACDELRGVEWDWQSFDCALGKSRHGGISSGPTRPIGPKTAPNAGI